MPDKFDLALEIAATHPQSVARYLEEHAPTSASSFIDAAPDKFSTQILESMLPYHAAKCLESLPVAAAARYIAALEVRFAAAILRHVPEISRNGIVSAMPRQMAARTTILLRYPLSVVGAWLNPAIMVLPLDCRIAEARTRVLREGYVDFHRIYIVDTEQRISGYIRLFHLMQAEDSRHLSEILEPSPPPLRANMSLTAALENQRWLESDYLPVINRQERLIGVVRYADLRAAVSKPRAYTVEDDISGSFMDLAETCYLGLADVLNTSLAMGPAQAIRGEK